MNNIAIIIRTLNEGQYLESVIKSILKQRIDNCKIYIIIVDSGSTDNTLEIAKSFNTKVINILKKDFTYGYALNIGLEYAKDIASIGISLSGHCIPNGKYWLKNLVEPILSEKAVLSFGSHIGGDDVRTSEYNYFKYKYSKLKKGESSYNYFNNGNSAFLISVWKEYKFNEKLMAQEDVFFAKKVEKEKKKKIYYSQKAMVIHVHNDSNIKLYRRLFNEFYVEYSFKLRKKSEFFFEIINIISHIKLDIKKAKLKGKFKKALPGIIKFRLVHLFSLLGALLLSTIKSINE